MTLSNTKTYDFDTIHDRSNTSSIKWSIRLDDEGQRVNLKEDDLPFWVADMDFPNPPEIREALKKRIDHGFFGYTSAPEALNEAIVARMKKLHDWDIQADWILYNPGMVMFLGAVTASLTSVGSGILMNTPVYGPFLSRPKHYQRFAQGVPMVRVDDDAHTFHYEIDFDAFEKTITAQTELYYLCNPHNPTGTHFTREELQRLAEICLKHDVVIASDDIHCDLMLGGAEYIPIATLSPEIEHNTITMLAGTKTYNMAGLACSVAIVPDPEKRKKIADYSWGSGYHVDTLAYEALLAGYQKCDSWLEQTCAYITDNRDYFVQYMRDNLPMVKMTVPDATYLALMDFSAIDIPEKYSSVTDYFAEEAGIIFTPGSFFGDDLNNYARINLACPRALLTQGLERMAKLINSA